MFSQFRVLGEQPGSWTYLRFFVLASTALWGLLTGTTAPALLGLVTACIVTQRESWSLQDMLVTKGRR